MNTAGELGHFITHADGLECTCGLHGCYELYEKTFPEFRYRLRVKAGLTGYAQVTGVYDTTPYDKLRMDLMYIENYSLFRDIQIVLMTVKTMLFPVQKSNAELLHPRQKTDKR